MMNEPRIAIFANQLELWSGEGHTLDLTAWPVDIEQPIPQDVRVTMLVLHKFGKQGVEA